MLQSVSFSMKEARGRLKFLLLAMLKIRLDKALWIILSNLEVQHTFEMSNFEGGGLAHIASLFQLKLVG